MTEKDTLPPDKKAWSLRQVAGWCERRAEQTEDRRLLKRLWARFRIGSKAITPYERFIMCAQQEVDEKTEFWLGMAQALRVEADKEDSQQ